MVMDGCGWCVDGCGCCGVCVTRSGVVKMCGFLCMTIARRRGERNDTKKLKDNTKNAVYLLRCKRQKYQKLNVL